MWLTIVNAVRDDGSSRREVVVAHIFQEAVPRPCLV